MQPDCDEILTPFYLWDTEWDVYQENNSLSCAISFSNTNYDHHGKKTHFQIEENPETEARSGRAVESSCHERMLSEWQSKQEAGCKALCCPFKG